MTRITTEFLDELFPLERTEAFFDALFGGAEEGAYDIVLRPRKESDKCVELAFELHQRPGKCLVCNLTYGLSGVFRRHPIINARGVAEAVAQKMGWKGCTWEIDTTREESSAMHWLPFRIMRAE